MANPTSETGGDTVGCATCKYMIVPPDARGRCIVRNGKVYLCGYVVQWPSLPNSITQPHRWRLPDPGSQIVWRGYGVGCPTWERLK